MARSKKHNKPKRVHFAKSTTKKRRSEITVNDSCGKLKLRIRMLKKMKKDEIARTTDLELEISRLHFSIEAESNFNRLVFINTSFTSSGLFDLDGQIATWLLEYGAVTKKKSIVETLPPKFIELAKTLTQDEKSNSEIEVAAKAETKPGQVDTLVTVMEGNAIDLDKTGAELLPNDFFEVDDCEP